MRGTKRWAYTLSWIAPTGKRFYQRNKRVRRETGFRSEKDARDALGAAIRDLPRDAFVFTSLVERSDDGA